MLNVLIYVIPAVFSIAGITLVIWLILNIRRKRPSAARLDRMAEKVYLAVVDFIAKTHQGQLPLEAVPPFEKLSEPLKNLYREIAKRHFM